MPSRTQTKFRSGILLKRVPVPFLEAQRQIVVLQCRGNDVADLLPTLERARDLSSEGPVAVIAHSTKGHGISFAAGQVGWHSQVVTDELARRALRELGALDEEG